MEFVTNPTIITVILTAVITSVLTALAVVYQAKVRKALVAIIKFILYFIIETAKSLRGLLLMVVVVGVIIIGIYGGKGVIDLAQNYSITKQFPLWILLVPLVTVFTRYALLDRNTILRSDRISQAIWPLVLNMVIFSILVNLIGWETAALIASMVTGLLFAKFAEKRKMLGHKTVLVGMLQELLILIIIISTPIVQTFVN